MTSQGQHTAAFSGRSIAGTSTVQIEDTYARWPKRTHDQLRATFDAYDAIATG
jgi:hypothetical protein